MIDWPFEINCSEVSLGATRLIGGGGGGGGAGSSLIERVAVLIVPSVAPPAGWLSVRLTVVVAADWLGLGRIVIGKRLLRVSLAGKKRQSSRGGHVLLAGDGRAVAGGVLDGHERARRCPRVRPGSSRRPPTNRPRTASSANWTLTGCAVRSWANSDVSPVNSLVAVALTHVFAGTPLCGVSETDGHTVCVGCDRLRSQQRLPLAITGWIGRRVAEKLDEERRIRQAVQARLGRALGAGDDGGHHRGILKIVGPDPHARARWALRRSEDRPAAARSMPRCPFEKMLFERIESPVPDWTSTPAATL